MFDLNRANCHSFYFFMAALAEAVWQLVDEKYLPNFFMDYPTLHVHSCNLLNVDGS
jgi:hypothetical protein